MKLIYFFALTLFFQPVVGQTLEEKQHIKFNEYKSCSFSEIKVKFTEGEFTLFKAGTETVPNNYCITDITAQKRKIDENTYDASGMILIKESSQEIFWNSNKTHIQGKIFAFVKDRPKWLSDVNQNTRLASLDKNNRTRVEHQNYTSLFANPSYLQITADKSAMSELEIKNYNGYDVAYRYVKAKSKIDLTIHSYIFFVGDGKIFDFKIIIADDERKLILEDLIDKTLNSIEFFGTID